jgi:inhibitor of cysteine peptidase
MKLKILTISPALFLNKRKIVATGLLAFIGGILIGALLLSFGPLTPLYTASGQPLLRFSSYEELVTFVNKTSSYPWMYNQEGVFSFGQRSDLTQAAMPSYSTTNIQVAGVDEADIVKSDGEHFYVVSNRTVFIVKAFPLEEAGIVSKIELNETPLGIYINVDNDKLVIFSSNDQSFYRYYYWEAYTASKTSIKVYNVHDKSSPTLTRNVTLDGSYFSSRMIGNYVYAVANEPALLDNNTINLPVIYSNEQTGSVPATHIYYSNVTDYGYSFSTVIAVNVQNDVEQPTHETFLIGAATNMFVSLNNIYLAIPGQQDAFGIDRTLIYRIRIEGGDVESQASGAVPGRVLNQFSMDEYDGNFRIATTTGSLWSGDSRNHVYVLNVSLAIVGRLEGLARGEQIYSARFVGKKFYLVTFKKVDPLFVIDLQDPKNPRVLGELKITGYSDYLHPYDENHVIGIGKEAVAAEWEGFSWYQGVKMSFFDVSNPLDPQEIDNDEIGDRGTDSPVLRDHKAFLFNKEKQLLVIPVLVAKIDASKYPSGVPTNAYGDYVWQGAYVYSITLQGLELRGNITHIENGIGLQSNYYYYSPFSVKRALYVDSVLYTISDRKIVMNSLESLENLGEILLQ